MKKWILLFGVLLLTGIYLRRRYDVRDFLSYSRKNPGSRVSAPMDYYVGWYYYFRGNYPYAVEAFRQLLKDHTTHYYAPQALIRLGDIYERQPDYPKAREVYQKYLELFPDSSDQLMVNNKLEYIKFK